MQFFGKLKNVSSIFLRYGPSYTLPEYFRTIIFSSSNIWNGHFIWNSDAAAICSQFHNIFKSPDECVTCCSKKNRSIIDFL